MAAAAACDEGTTFPVLSAMLGGPAPQFAFFGAVVAALTILLVYTLPETRGIDFG